jgi:hypothetical protein
LVAEAAVVAEPLRSSKTMFAPDAVAVTVTEAELSRSKKTTTAVVVVAAAKELQSASPVRIVVDVIGTGVVIMAKDVIGTGVAILDAAERPLFYEPCRRGIASSRSAVADAALSSPRGSAPTAPS